MKKLYFSIILQIVSLVSLAQNNGIIKGTITDLNGSKLNAIQVNLKKIDGNVEEKNISTATITDALGNFYFDKLKKGKYKVTIEEFGYNQFESDVIKLNNQYPEVNLPIIELTKSDGTNLSEVIVKSKIPFIIQKSDRTIVNPEALIANAGGNALDALSKSPGVIVDENGNISLKGKSGVTIFIDDKPIYLSGAELENYLKSLPSSAIKQIELMPNPPAQYEASGNSGIINIKTKRSKLAGLNGNVSGSFGQGKYARTNDNLNLNYNTNKFALFSNTSYSNSTSFHDLTINRKFKNPDLTPKSGFEQNTYLKTKAETYNINLGLDYYISNSNTIGISTKALLSKTFRPRYNKALVTDENNQLTQTVIADNKEDIDFKNYNITLNFRHQFSNPDKQFTTDFDYVTYKSKINQLYKNDLFLPDGTNSYSDIQNGNLPSTIKIYAYKSDYSTPLSKNSKLDIGVKSSYTKTDNNAIYTITQDGITVDNYNLSNHFFYDELINSAYINTALTYKKFDFQVGFRFEDTKLKGKQLGNPNKPYSEFRNNYNSIFPTVYVNFKIDSIGTKSLNLSYGKRLNRPFYKDLNPFSSPLDQYTFYEGNPYLKPTFSHNFSLAHNYRELLSTTFSYSYTIDDIKETIEINNGIYYSRPNNIGKSSQFNLSFQSKFNLYKWLTTIIYTEVTYAKFKSKLYNQTLNTSGTNWFINSVNSFKFSDKWVGEISGQYLTKFIDSQFTIGDFGFVSLGLQKKMFNDLGILKLSISDVFFTNRIRGTINNLELTDANWYGPRDTRIVTLTFSYRIGKNTNKKVKYESKGSETEQNRVKSP